MCDPKITSLVIPDYDSTNYIYLSLCAISNDLGNHGFPQFSISIAFSNSATSLYLTPLSPIHSFKFAIQSDCYLPLLLLPLIFAVSARFSKPSFLIKYPRNLICFVLISKISCLFQLFAKSLHFLLCLSKESSSFISKTTFHSFPNTFSYQMLLTKFCFHIIASGTHSSSVLTFLSSY